MQDIKIKLLEISEGEVVFKEFSKKKKQFLYHKCNFSVWSYFKIKKEQFNKAFVQLGSDSLRWLCEWISKASVNNTDWE